MQASHMVIVKGPDQGKQFTIPSAGGRVGRSSKNDIVLNDPSLSRHHCRLFFKLSDGLWITDLGSANQTIVNNAPIQEVRLHIHDTIAIGETELRILDDRPVEQMAEGSTAPATAAVVDLGFVKPGPETSARKTSPLTLWVAGIGLTIVALAGIVHFMSRPSAAPKPPKSPNEPARLPIDSMVEIDYEKIQANTQNIFRYRLTLAPNRTLAVQIDDIQNKRHVRKEVTVDEPYIRLLAKTIQDSGFFALEPEYRGVQPSVLESWDITVTLGRQTYRSQVVNRNEPDIFRTVREKLEENGKNQLGLAAIEFSAERLLKMAQDAFQQGRKLYDEREVKYENITGAIKSFREAEWYLETVEPKPDFYAQLVGLISTCNTELKGRFEDLNFRAQRAKRLRDWSDAAQSLRIICDMIPDRSDPRNIQARKELLDVENNVRMDR